MVIIDPGIKVDRGYKTYDNGLEMGVFIRVCMLVYMCIDVCMCMYVRLYVRLCDWI